MGSRTAAPWRTRVGVGRWSAPPCTSRRRLGPASSTCAAAESRSGRPSKARLGFALPEPNRAAGNDGVGVLWLGPDEWLVTCNADHEAALLRSLGNALAGIHAAVTDVTDTRTVTRVSGPGAREVLATGCTLDLHPRVFAAGHVAQSTLAKAEVILHQTAADDAADGPAYEIYVLRSFADYLWRWLEDAARA